MPKNKRYEETPLMLAKDIIRNLVTAGASFNKCQFQRCTCGQIRQDCRNRWHRWEKALRQAERKLNEFKEKTE